MVHSLFKTVRQGRESEGLSAILPAGACVEKAPWEEVAIFQGAKLLGMALIASDSPEVMKPKKIAARGLVQKRLKQQKKNMARFLVRKIKNYARGNGWQTNHRQKKTQGDTIVQSITSFGHSTDFPEISRRKVSPLSIAYRQRLSGNATTI